MKKIVGIIVSISLVGIACICISGVIFKMFTMRSTSSSANKVEPNGAAAIMEANEPVSFDNITEYYQYMYEMGYDVVMVNIPETAEIQSIEFVEGASTAFIYDLNNEGFIQSDANEEIHLGNVVEYLDEETLELYSTSRTVDYKFDEADDVDPILFVQNLAQSFGATPILGLTNYYRAPLYVEYQNADGTLETIRVGNQYAYATLDTSTNEYKAVYAYFPANVSESEALEYCGVYTIPNEEIPNEPLFNENLIDENLGGNEL